MWLDAADLEPLCGGGGAAGAACAPATLPSGGRTAVAREALDRHLWELRSEHEVLLSLAHEQEELGPARSGAEELRLWRRRCRRLRSLLPGGAAAPVDPPTPLAARLADARQAALVASRAQAQQLRSLVGQFAALQALPDPALAALAPPAAPAPAGVRRKPRHGGAAPPCSLRAELATHQRRCRSLEATLQHCRVRASELRAQPDPRSALVS